MAELIVPREARIASATQLSDFIVVYAKLLTAAWEAAEARKSPHDNAVALEELCDQGDVVLWLLFQGHVTVTTAGTHCLLTPSGEVFASSFIAEVLLAPDEKFIQVCRRIRIGRLSPRYDGEDRAFYWGRHLVKHYRQPSVNQEIVLRSAEEMNWPDWFDDPLPGGHERPKTRLHDTIKDLNRRQIIPVIHFKGDGTGTRIGWELR